MCDMTTPAIEATVPSGDDERCRAVEEALIRRACGYSVTVKKPFKLKVTDYDENTGKKITEREMLQFADEEEYLPPDLRFCSYYLNNRAPDRWRDEPGRDTESHSDGVIAYPPMVTVTPPAEPDTEEVSS